MGPMKETTLRDYQERILRVLVHIQENLDAAISLERLAEVAGFSPFHFHRIFRGMVGESLKGHVRRLRLERAALRLKHTQQPVTNIAFEAGYETHEAFTRAFGAMFGSAPSHFRKQRRELSLMEVSSGVHYGPAEHLDKLALADPGRSELKVRVEELAPLRVAFMRHTGPYDECGRTWERFVPRMGAQGWIGADTQLFAVCHDDPDLVSPEKIRYDVCVSVDESFEPEGEVGVQLIPGGPHAMATHHGPYEQLGAIYLQLFGCWLPRSGRVTRPLPCREVYLNDPESTEPEELLTDIYIPLEPLR